MKTLNKDMKLIQKPNLKYDIDFIKEDLHTVTDIESVHNAIILSVLTGYQELKKTNNPTYSDFGDKAYECLKMNKNKNTKYLLQKYLETCILNIRRIKQINKMTLKESNEGYKVHYNITTITDEQITGDVTLEQ